MLSVPAEPAAAEGTPSAQIQPSGKARVFFALWPPEVLAAELAGIARQFAEASGGRPGRQETLHLTLAFLGDVAETRLPELCRLAAAIHVPAFELQLDKLDFWSHNHLLWCGCTAPPSVLGQLVDELRNALISAGFKLADPDGRFVPHVSLVRRVPASESSASFRLGRVLSLPAWQCNQIVLVRSYLSPSGPDYQVVARFNLA